MVIFITGQLDSISKPLKRAAKKVHDSGGKIVAYKLNDVVNDEVLERVVPKDGIIKVDSKDDPWRLAMLFDFQTRKGRESFVFCRAFAHDVTLAMLVEQKSFKYTLLKGTPTWPPNSLLL